MLNKVDLLEPDELAPLERDLRAINPIAAIIRATNSEVATDALLGVSRFSLPNVLAIEPGLLQDEHDHEHDTSIISCAVETSHALDPDRFNRWVNQLVQQQGQHIMRMKGVLNFSGEARQFYFHSVHMLLDAKPGRPWQSAESRQSRFVFIGRHLDRAGAPTGVSRVRARHCSSPRRPTGLVNRSGIVRLQHYLGGLENLGPVNFFEKKVFMAEWEKRIFGIHTVMMAESAIWPTRCRNIRSRTCRPRSRTPGPGPRSAPAPKACSRSNTSNIAIMKNGSWGSVNSSSITAMCPPKSWPP